MEQEPETDRYGNTEGDLRNCCFPCCGCDGARLCMAKNGPSFGALVLNIEQGTDLSKPPPRPARSPWL